MPCSINKPVSHTYGALTRLTQATDPTGAHSFTYDNLGRLTGTGTQYSFLSGTLANSYAYDAASNRVSLTDPAGGVSTYSYDSLNRLTGLTDFNSASSGFGGACPERSRRNALGRRTSLTRPNGVNTSYTYDADSNRLSLRSAPGEWTIFPEYPRKR